MGTSLDRIEGRRPPALRWLVAAMFLGVAFALSVLFRDYIRSTTFVVFFGAVAGTAYFSGGRAALLVAGLAVLLTNVYLVEPYGQLHLNNEGLVNAVVRFTIAGCISWLTHELWETRSDLARHADQLEENTRQLEAQ